MYDLCVFYLFWNQRVVIMLIYNFKNGILLMQKTCKFIDINWILFFNDYRRNLHVNSHICNLLMRIPFPLGSRKTSSVWVWKWRNETLTVSGSLNGLTQKLFQTPLAFKADRYFKQRMSYRFTIFCKVCIFIIVPNEKTYDVVESF